MSFRPAKPSKQHHTKRAIALYQNAASRAYTPDDKPMMELIKVRAARTASPLQRDPRKVYERDVLKAALKYLRHHPRVASVERTQSGVFAEGNRTIRVGFVGKLDISGVLKGGRAFEFEAKRPGGKLSVAQANRIVQLQNAGVLSGCFDSVDGLETLMRGA